MSATTIVAEIEDLQKVFKYVDKDSSGYIDFNELETALKNIGEDYSLKEVQEFLAEGKDSGVLDFDEFAKLVIREGWELPASEHFTETLPKSDTEKVKNQFAKKSGEKEAKSVGAKSSSEKSKFGSTQNKCRSCNKTVYPIESIKIDELLYHKRCFRCTHCRNKLSIGGYAMIHSDPYCKPHFKQLFKESGGKYDRAFGSSPSGTKGEKISEAKILEGEARSKATTKSKNTDENVSVKKIPKYICKKPCSAEIVDPSMLLIHMQRKHNRNPDELLEKISQMFSDLGEFCVS